MKLWKKILIVIAIIIVIPFIVAIFVKGDYIIQREIAIKKPKAEVFDYLKLLKNQDKFSKWAKMDPNMKQTFKGTDGTVGFVSAWESDMKDVGQGEQEISNIVNGERLDYIIHFIKPMDSHDNASLITTEINASETKVQWVFSGKVNYPMNLLCLFMNFDKLVGPDLEIGLKNLKANLETPVIN